MDGSRGKYKTKQRSLILETLKETAGDGGHLSAEAIAERLAGRAGQATIYRNLDELVKNGVVIKYEPGNGFSACYRLAADDRADDFCHFLCLKCGRMSHLDCRRLDELAEHVKLDHGLSLNLKRTVLYGTCGDCAETAR